MSEGPIKQWRDSWKPPTVSTTDTARLCMRSDSGVAYCGRRNRALVTDWGSVTCADCAAAARADLEETL